MMPEFPGIFMYRLVTQIFFSVIYGTGIEKYHEKYHFKFYACVI